MSTPEPIRVPVIVNDAAVDLYAIAAALLDADDRLLPTVVQPNAAPRPPIMPLPEVDEADAYVWDRLVYALARLESVNAAPDHERTIRRAVERCADAAANAGWTVDEFIARFHVATSASPPAAELSAESRTLARGDASLVGALRARFVTKVLDWGIERLLLAVQTHERETLAARQRRA